jgi:hypothetical protein
MRRLIDRLPISAVEQTINAPAGGSILIKPLQPIVWISVVPPQIVDLPPTAIRFPAVVDSGFNQTLLIQDQQLRDWAGVDPDSLAVFPGETARYGSQAWSFRIADIWLHPYPAQDSTPFCLETHPGILVVTEHQRMQRLPVLGLRALAWNRSALRLEFDGPTIGSVTLEVPTT